MGINLNNVLDNVHDLPLWPCFFINFAGSLPLACSVRRFSDRHLADSELDARFSHCLTRESWLTTIECTRFAAIDYQLKPVDDKEK